MQSLTRASDRRVDIPDRPGIFVRTPFGETHVVVDGDPGASVVVACIHGLPGSSRDFRRLGHALTTRGACCVRIDMPGYGKSPPSKALLRTPAQRAAFVEAVMKARGHRRFAVVGHSFGGSAALVLASTSTAVTAVALVCSIGTVRHRGLGIPNGITAAMGTMSSKSAAAARLLAPATAFLRQTMAALDPRAPLLSDAAVVDVTALIGGIDFADLRRAARNVRVPALVLSGGRDTIVEPRVGRILAASLSSSPLVSHRFIRDGSHFLQRDDAVGIAHWLTLVTPSADPPLRS